MNIPNASRQDRSGPPKPAGRLPLLGHAMQLRGNLLGTLESWAREVGDVYRLDVPGQDIWIVNRPEDIERIVVDSEHFTRGGSEMNHSKLAWGDSLMTSSGPLWKTQRRMMAPAFHKDRVAAHGQRMVELTEQALSRWPYGEVRSLRAEMTALTLRIITDALFGDGEVPPDEVGTALEDGMERFDGVRAVLPPWLIPRVHARYRAAVARLDKIVNDMIARRRTHEHERSDLLSLLLTVHDEDGTRMSDGLLRDEVNGLLLGGHETAAVALAWAWYAIARHPDVERCVLDEAAALAGPPTVADLQRLPYIEAVVKETMRFYPPIWMMVRIVLHDWEIAGYPAKRGAQVKMAAWIVQRDSRFFPDPLRFRPERWLDGSTSSLPKYAYFPFGGGQRLCIGRAFALLEMLLVLATIARQSRLRLVSTDEVAPIASFSLRPTGALLMRRERR
jgi:cytochrome P450